MLVVVKTLTGRRLAFDIEPTAKIMKLKMLLEDKEGVEVNQMRLIYGGKQLNDMDTINSVKIEPGGIIHMVLSLRGG